MVCGGVGVLAANYKLLQDMHLMQEVCVCMCAHVWLASYFKECALCVRC